MSNEELQTFVRILRSVLENRFNMTELQGIALDVEASLYNSLSQCIDFKAYSTALVDHCMRHGQLPILLALIFDRNVAAYEDLKDHIPKVDDFRTRLIVELRGINPKHAYLIENHGFRDHYILQERRDLILDNVGKYLSSNPEASRIFAVWGSPGCGKTSLLRQIVKEREQSAAQVRFVDFRELEKQGLMDETTLRRRICQGLRYGRFDYPVVEEVPLNRLSTLTVDELARARPVICLDNMDYLLHNHEEALLWFESNLLVRILARQPLTVVVTQTAKVPWTNSALSQISLHCQLLPYSDSFIEPQLAANIPADFCFRATYGHPPTISKLVESVVNMKFTYSESTDKQQEELIRSIHAWAKSYIVQRCRTLQLSDILILLCPLRWFTIGLMQKILRHHGRQTERSESQDLVHQLTSEGWIIWDPNWAMYRFSDGSARRLLSEEMKYTNTSQYKAINEVAFGHFEDGLKYERYLEKMVPEALYHLACQSSIIHNAKREIAKDCRDWLEKRGKQADQQWDTNAWNIITKALDIDEIYGSVSSGNYAPCENDVRVTLDNLTELRVLMGPNGYNDILDLARYGATIG